MIYVYVCVAIDDKHILARRTYRRGFIAITAVLSARRHARGRPASARARVHVPDDPSGPRIRPVGRSLLGRRRLVYSSCPAARDERGKLRRVHVTIGALDGSDPAAASMSIVRATCRRVRRRAASTPSWPSSALLVRRAATRHLRRRVRHTGRRARKQDSSH